MNALSKYLREQAAAHRATGAQRPADGRHRRSADALEALADHAEAGALDGLFQMRYLLEHHVADGRFAWPDGQSGRSIRNLHHSLDTGRRYQQLFVVGIPDWHAVDRETRAQLEAIDGVIVAHGTKNAYGDAPPLLVKNVPAASDDEARERVAEIAGIEPDALGVAASPRAS